MENHISIIGLVVMTGFLIITLVYEMGSYIHDVHFNCKNETAGKRRRKEFMWSLFHAGFVYLIFSAVIIYRTLR